MKYHTSLFFILFYFHFFRLPFFSRYNSFYDFTLPGRKRTRIASHSNSAELAQMVFNLDTPSMNTPLMNMPSNNESTEMSKEIKKMLEDRCSSSEFKDFVEHINLESKCRTIHIKSLKLHL